MTVSFKKIFKISECILEISYFKAFNERQFDQVLNAGCIRNNEKCLELSKKTT